MRAEEAWQPTKYVLRRGRWRASPDTAQVALPSRLVTDLVAHAYSEALREYASGDLLDLGAGRVPLYGAYRDLVDSVYCVDWEQSLHTTPHLDAVADLTKPLDLPSAGFDTVLLTDVLEHLPQPDVAMGEIARVLRPRGHLIAGVPFLYWIHEAPHDYHRYTEFRLRRFCDDHGLAVRHLVPYGDALHVVADILVKAVSRRLPFAAAAAGALAGQVARHRADATTRSPLGYVLVARRLDRSPLGS